MADNFLSKTRVAPEDFVETGGRPVLERHAELRALLTDRAGPEAAALFAEPLISRGNDAAPPTVAWYAGVEGNVRPLSALPGPERDRAETYLAEHLRPLRALSEDPSSADLTWGALSVYGGEDVLVVGTRPVIVNWGLMPGGAGAHAGTRPAHYAATLGKYLPLGDAGASAGMQSGAPPPSAPPPSAVPPAPAVAITAPAAVSGPRRVPALAWVPLLVLLVLAALFLAWLLMPGTRLFQSARTPPAITGAATLAAARELNQSLRERQAALEAALEGAVCRADGILLLPDGRTPEGLLPPPLGQAPERKARAAPDALLPNSPERVVVPDPDSAAGAPDQEISLLGLIEARTVLILAVRGRSLTTGSGFVVGPGLVVTNQHVIAEALGEDGQILVTGGVLSGPQPAELVKARGPLAETGADFALLRIAATDLPAFTVHLPPGTLKLNNVIAAGFPGDVLELDRDFAALKSGDPAAMPDLTVTDGTVNTEQQIGPGTRVLMHSAPLSAGNSGGPLVDMCGRLVGVNSFVRQGPMQNRGYALATGDLLAFLEDTPASPAVSSEPCAPLVVRAQAAPAPSSPAPSGSE